jgi:hypothetical protein
MLWLLFVVGLAFMVDRGSVRLSMGGCEVSWIEAWIMVGCVVYNSAIAHWPIIADWHQIIDSR